MTPPNGAGPATEGTVNEAPKIGTGERRKSNSRSVSKPQGQLFLRACDVGERQAHGYMQPAHLAKQNHPRGTDLTRMTIKGAIKQLAPPRTLRTPKQPVTKLIVAPAQIQPKPKKKQIDIIGAWLAASSDERVKAVAAIGLNLWLAAFPDEWWPLFDWHLADLRQPQAQTETVPADLIPDDLSISPFLRRPLSAESEALVS
jgi:hypothetical protein